MYNTLKILDTALQLRGIIDDFVSFQYCYRFIETGEFKIVAPATPRNVDLIKVNAFVAYDDSEEKEEHSVNQGYIGFIATVQIQLDSEGGEFIYAEGMDIKGLLQRRIETKQASEKTSILGILPRVISSTIFGAAERKRQMFDYIPPYTIVGDVPSEAFDFQTMYGNTIYEEINSLCHAANTGYYFIYYPRNQFNQPTLMMVINGLKDKTDIIVNRDYDNVITQDYVSSVLENRNAVYCHVDVEGINDFIEEKSDARGIERYEHYLVSSLKLEQDDGSVISASELINQVRREARGEYKFTSQAFDCDLVNVSLEVGDVVRVVDNHWKINYTATITTKQITIENGVKTETYIIGEDI